MASITPLLGAVQGGALRASLKLPGPVRRRLSGKPIVVDGKRLHPEMQLLLSMMKVSGPPAESLPISKGRAAIELSSRAAAGRQPIGAVTDRAIEGPLGDIQLRFYTPAGISGSSPALVYLHGGGWIYGSTDSHDALCRVLAEQAQVRVISVQYRLAPESPFPGAPDECWAAWEWVNEHAIGLGIDPNHIAVGGDSAGGNLAAVIAQEAVRRKTKAPAFQLLIYPATDFSQTYPSERTFGEGFFLTKEFMDLAKENYLVGNEDLTDPRLSPLHGSVKGVAPAYVVTAGFDPLLDEGAAYAQKLQDAGVDVDYVCEEGLIHGFANMPGVGTAAPKAIARIATALQRGLS